jgi:hypothetical protein
MNTVPFREVFDRTLSMHGRDPRASVPSDLRDGLMRYINARVGTICKAWRWPEWELTEERPFRQVWNVNHQYQRVSTLDGKPDEVFYLGDSYVVGGEFTANFGYYRVLDSGVTDPPVGTLPTNTLFFTRFEDVDTYVAYEQTCRRTVGMALGVYSQNPRVPTCSSNGRLKFMPSDKGIDICCPGVPTVFLHYKMPVPKYTMTPYVVGKAYPKASVVFEPISGECFQALALTSSLPVDQNFWRRVPFLNAWSDYVCQGAFADSLMEFDQGGGQPSIPLVQYWTQQANDSFQAEVDSLVIQGQRLRWNFSQRNCGCWCDTGPWSGGSVHELTSICEDELGWIYPSAPSGPAVRWEYLYDIVALLSIDGVPSLQGLVTAGYFNVLSLVEIVIIPDGGSRTRMTFELVAGPADVDDPGHVQPNDYDDTENNVHWEKSG